MTKQVFDYGIELEFEYDIQSNSNIEFLEKFLSSFQVEENNEITSVKRFHKDSEILNKVLPIPHYLHRNVFLVSYYTDGSVSDEIVLASNNESSLNLVAREFNKQIEFSYDREGQHISINRNKFDDKRILDHFEFLNAIYCIGEFVLLNFNNQRHRNNDYSRNFVSPFIKERYPALLLNKKVEKSRFIEFRFCNPKLRPFTQLFTKILPNYFNTVDEEEIENIMEQIKHLDYDTRNPQNILSSSGYKYILKNTKLGKIFNFWKSDKLHEVFNLLKKNNLTSLNAMMKNFIKNFEEVRELKNEDIETLEYIIGRIKLYENSDIYEFESSETITDYNIIQYRDLPDYYEVEKFQHNLNESWEISETVKYLAVYSGTHEEKLYQKLYSFLMFKYRPSSMRYDKFQSIVSYKSLIDEFKENSSVKLVVRILFETLGDFMPKFPHIARYVKNRTFWNMNMEQQEYVRGYF